MYFYILIGIIYFLQFRDSFQAALKIEDDPNVPYIEEFISGIDESDFSEDAIVIRHPPPNEVKFKNPTGFRNGTTVFNQKPLKKEIKNVIVLSGYDDYIRRSDSSMTEQRVFVTLTKKSGQEDQYYVNYAYVRNLYPGEDPAGSFVVGNEIRRIELDSWDRRGADNNLETRMGWSVCSKSFFITCLGDSNRLISYELGDEPDYPDEVTESGGNPHTPTLDDPNEPSSVQYYHGFFTDLSDEFTHSWFVGASVVFVTNAKLNINTRVEESEPSDLVAASSAATKRKRQLSGFTGAFPGGELVNVGQPTREELQICLQYLASKNVGGRGNGLADKTLFGLNQVANSLGDGTQQHILGGGGGRGRYGTEDSAGEGLLKPIDTIGQFLTSFAGYKPGQDSNRSPGTALMNGARNGAITFGLSEGIADALGQAIGVGKVSNDRSHLDSLTDDIFLGVGSVGALGLDLVDKIAKPLGLSPILNKLAGMTGTILTAAASVVFAPVKLALDFGKVGAKALGLGGLFGMKGSSDNAAVKYCINNMAIIKQALEVERQKLYPQAGRGFGSKAINMENINEKSDKANVDAFNPIGWRGLYMHQSEPFIGFGSCIVDDNITLSDLTSLNTSSDAAEFYLKTLRTHCNPDQISQFLDLIKTGELVYNETDNTFFVSPSHFARSTKKLLPKEAARFSQAFEVQEYSRAYVTEFMNLTKELRNPDNLLIHRAVNTIRNMALNAFSVAITEFPNHSIKLIRNILITLKTALVRLLQSWQVLAICQRCLPQEQYVIGDGLVTILSVMDFIMYKFEPLIPSEGISNTEVVDSYNSFYHTQRMVLARRLAAYVLPPHGQMDIDVAAPEDVTFVEAQTDAPNS